MRFNKENKHFASPSRFLAPIRAEGLAAIKKAMGETAFSRLGEFGRFVEQGFSNYNTAIELEKAVNLYDCMYDMGDQWYKKFKAPWHTLISWMEKNGLSYVDHEIYLRNEELIYHGFADLLLKDKDDNLYLIEVKTRNIEKTTIMETDKLQLHYYQMAANTSDRFKDKNVKYYIVVVDRKGRDLIAEEQPFSISINDKCMKLIEFYDTFTRPEIDNKKIARFV